MSQHILSPLRNAVSLAAARARRAIVFKEETLQMARGAGGRR